MHFSILKRSLLISELIIFIDTGDYKKSLSIYDGKAFASIFS